jgi:hypothetical protein
MFHPAVELGKGNRGDDGDSHDGVAVELLEAGTTLVVRTLNSRYRLTVLDGADSTVLVAGGSLFPIPTEAVLRGSSSSGSPVQTGWIGVGRRVELCVGPRRIITSPVHSLTIESRPQLR